MAALLGLVVSVLVLLGVLLTPWLIAAIAPGFTGVKRELTIQLVRIFFPGAGLLVLSAWCLGVLNSHRRFLISYSAPVVWNITIIGTLIFFGRNTDLARLAVLTAWGAVAGCLLQLLVQLPGVRAAAGHIPFRVPRRDPHLTQVVHNFIPALLSRGVVQISAFLDVWIASFLPAGAVTALGTTQVLYSLPVSLFGISVSAAELPEMAASGADSDESRGRLRVRLEEGLRRIAFGVVPSAMAFAALGQILAAAIFQSGAFTAVDSQYVWGILAGAAVGLVASTQGRLYSSAHYALHDTRSPLNFAVIRVVLTVALGLAAALWLPDVLGIERRWGAAGLTLTAGISGWVELRLLRRSLDRRIGHTATGAGYLAKLWLAAAAAAGLALLLQRTLPPMGPVLRAVYVLGAYGVAYLALTLVLRVPAAVAIRDRVLEHVGRQG